jgi:Domain of unknown function (DUF6259)
MRRALLTFISVCACGWSQAQVSFDGSAPDRLRVAANNYELILSKTNGAILGIADRTTNVQAPVASRNGCLWGSNYSAGPTTYRGGCNFGAGRPDAFRYDWDATRNILTLQYNSASMSSQRVDATVTMVFQAGWFDLNLSLTNHMGAPMQAVLFPSDLLFANNSVDAAYVPYYLPGARLMPGFFTGHRSISITYPSARAFADYLALDWGGGHLAWYSINPSMKSAPVVLGFQDDDRSNPGSFYAFHTFQSWTPDGGRFDTPAMRIQVGASPQDSATLYRVENGIADYPSLADKLGELAPTLAAAPLVKMDFRSIGKSFAGLSAVLGLIRAPAILHPVSYWPRAFDQNYPDFLPPDPRFGATDDFHAFVDAAHSRGLLVMPYTNPTWWDDQSPTVRLAPDIAALAVLGQNGNPVYETYGPNRGFVASPHSPAVQDRLSVLMAQWRDNVPVDLVFHDQIGSRSWLRDFNPMAPDPQSYSDKWLEFARVYAAQNLMTEDGWDRMASVEIGFAGSLLTGTNSWNPTQVRWGAGSRGNQAFGVGLWEPYPIGVWMFHDKVLFYHHDLDDLPMNAGVEVLTWNAAFGVMAGYYWPELRSPNPDWAAIAAAFQPAVMSRAAGRILSSYRTLADGVTESRFDGLSIVANWNAGSTHQMNGFTIAPSGCLARADDGSVLAGVFVDQFQGTPLSPGVHYLVIERHTGAVIVRQPSGPDTSVAITLPPDWNLSDGVMVKAVSRDNQPIAKAQATVDGSQASFVYARSAAGVPVDHYEISPATP